MYGILPYKFCHMYGNIPYISSLWRPVGELRILDYPANRGVPASAHRMVRSSSSAEMLANEAGQPVLQLPWL